MQLRLASTRACAHHSTEMARDDERVNVMRHHALEQKSSLALEHVRVYGRFNNDWSQLGQDIDGRQAGEILGTSVSLSNDGRTLLVGSPGNGTKEEYAEGYGYARVHKFKKGQWIQIGEGLQGEYEGDAFGASVSLSSDGSIVAVGAPKNREGNGAPNGHVRLYRLQYG